MRPATRTAPAAARARLLLAAAAATGGGLAAAAGAGAWGPPCTAETTCVGLSSFPRCLDSHASGVGAPCTLDYEYNETSRCSCGAQACVPLNSTRTTSKKQLLVIGDSISLGYTPYLTANLSSGWEVVHAPGDCGNANWGALCGRGWLGADPARWDAVTVNHGLHDLAFPDNEHLDVPTYVARLANETAVLRAALRPGAALVWMTTTPVPTNPPPQCVLIPRRLQSDVAAYNAAAAGVVAAAGMPTCDLEAVINAVCGPGYATCPIAQCQGPHFTEAGFQLLGAAAAGCVTKAAAAAAAVAAASKA